MIVLDNPDLINDSSVLLSTDLLDPQMTGVGEVEPAVPVVCGHEGGPLRVVLVEVVMFLPAARRASGDVHCSPGLGVGSLGAGAGHHRPVVGREQPLIAVLVSPD